MDAFKVDYADFWTTVPRGAMATVADLRACRVRAWACAASTIRLDESLVECEVVFLFRFPRSPEIRVSSECRVCGIGPNFRNVAGVPQTNVMFTRSDGTNFDIGMNMESYWQPETDHMDYNWFVKRLV